MKKEKSKLTLTLTLPIKVKKSNLYYLIIEDAEGVNHFFSKKYTTKIEGKKRHFKQGEYDGWCAPCKG